MACTPGSSLTDSCMCLGMTTQCGSGKYCYDGQCTTGNKCGVGACKAECFCVGSNKVAVKCHGDNKYCKDGRVMTVCTAASLATEECACSIGDTGICMGFCDDGTCRPAEACEYDNSNHHLCVCAPAGKKIGVYLTSQSSICKEDGSVTWIEGGCTTAMYPSDECKCKVESEPCASGAACNDSSCESSNICVDGQPCVACLCIGASKIAQMCMPETDYCKNGVILALPGKSVCLESHHYYSRCYCSEADKTICGESMLCGGSDCFTPTTVEKCTAGSVATKNCYCKMADNKIAVMTAVGDICNDDETVSRICVNGVPNQRDACKCGGKEGPECKKGDVCINSKCYGNAGDATGRYCEHGKACDPACACADRLFAGAELCDGAGSTCLTAVPSKKNGLGIGAIIGIVVAALVVLIAIFVAVFCLLKRRKQEQEEVACQEERKKGATQVAVK